MHRHETEDRVVLRQFGKRDELRLLDDLSGAPDGDAAWTVAIVDVETTGLDPDRDQIIQFAALVFDVDKHGSPVNGRRVLSFDVYSDPGRPIPPVVQKLTGIRDKDVAGRSLDRPYIAAVLDTADVIIAHNARFDRAFVDAELAAATGPSAPVWACSQRMIDWRGKHGAASAALQPLLWQIAARYLPDGGHQAGADVLALAYLLMRHESIPDLCKAATSPRHIVDVRSPYDPSGKAQTWLKRNAYRWQADSKTWSRELDDAEDAATAALEAVAAIDRAAVDVRTADASTRYAR